jgi:hypothetical protein
MSYPDGSPLMIEDLLPMSDWKRTAVFNEFYAKLEMRARLSLSLSFSRPDITGVVAHRPQGTFSERDRSVPNLLGFHISQACANAKVHPPPAFPSIMGALESLVGGSIIALDAAGKVQFCSNWRGDTPRSFFAKERPFHHGIPLTVKAWALQKS